VEDVGAEFFRRAPESERVAEGIDAAGAGEGWPRVEEIGFHLGIAMRHQPDRVPAAAKFFNQRGNHALNAPIEFGRDRELGVGGEENTHS
jgi:hypothetical protein